jgi:hypothetical protein
MRKEGESTHDRRTEGAVMKKPTDWTQMLQIFHQLEDRLKKKITFPVRGSSPKKIAYYLLTNYREALTDAEEFTATTILNRGNFGVGGWCTSKPTHPSAPLWNEIQLDPDPKDKKCTINPKNQAAGYARWCTKPKENNKP